jgi:outer membrane lipoprotein-sorting protein
LKAFMRAIGRTLTAAAMAVLAIGAAQAQSAPPPAGSSTDAALVRQRLQLAPVLHGDFEQTKTIQGFRHALVSHGEFIVARGQGVWWHTQQPYESTLVVTRTRLFTRAADGSAANVMDAQTEPGLRQVNELLFSLLSADLDALVDRFTIAAQAQGATGWTLTLTPRDANVARFLTRATLTGERFVQTVRIDEARGDTTQIRFSRQSPSAALSPAEAARLQ